MCFNQVSQVQLAHLETKVSLVYLLDLGPKERKDNLAVTVYQVNSSLII